MPLNEYSNYDMKTMEAGSVNPVPEEEFGQSDTAALAQTLNSTYASIKKWDIYKQEHDVSQFEGKPFNYETFDASLEGRGLSPTVMHEAKISHLTSWQDAESRVAWLVDQETKERQVQENFSTAGMIAAGIPLVLADPLDALALSPILAGAIKAKKVMNLSSRAGKIAGHALTGAAVSAGSMMTYEVTTGIYKDDSLIESAVVGLAIGGILGPFMSKAPMQETLTTSKDFDGRILSDTEVNIEKRATADVELQNINNFTDEVKQIKEELKGTEGEFKTLFKTDKEAATAKAAKAKQEKLDIYNLKQRAVEAASKGVKTARDKLQPVTDTVAANVKAIKELQSSSRKVVKDIESQKILQKDAPKLEASIVKLRKEIYQLKEKSDTKSVASLAKAGAELAKIRKALATNTAKIKDLQASISKVDSDPVSRINILKEQNKPLVKQLKDMTATLNKRLATVKAAKGDRSSAKADKEEAKLRVKNEEVLRSPETASLEEKLVAYGVDLSNDGLRALASKKGLLEADIAKMEAGDFKTKAVYGVATEKRNFIQKLSDELDEIGKIPDFRKSVVWKRVHPALQKILISPVSKLLNSKNDEVSGLATLLATGTLSQGVARTYNALNVRKLMDIRRDRMINGIVNSYREAKQAGYKGNMTAFELEVSNNAHKVTGQMQRDMSTNIPPTVVGKDREAIVFERASSVERQVFSDNEWITKASDDFLDYYEYVHAKGKTLEMPSFVGSIGKAYINRVYSRDKIIKMGGVEVAINKLVKMQEDFAIATSSELTPTTRLEFEAKARTAMEGTLDHTMRVRQVTAELGVPVQSTTTSLKQRSIDAFDDDLSELLEDNLADISHMYALQTHGRIALKEKIGVDTDQQMGDLINNLKGATADEVDNLRVLVETIKGTREMSSNPFDPFTRAVKAISSYSSVMHTMGFMIPTITEVSSIAKEFGWSKTISDLIGRPKDVYDAYRNGTPSEKNSILLMISYGNAYFGKAVARQDNAADMVNIDKTQEFMDGLVHKEAIFGGLLPLTDMLRMTTASLTVDFMAGLSVASKISKADMARLNDMGFDAKDLERIRTTLKVAPDGTIGNLDRKTWGQLDEDITLAVLTTVERTILHPDGATLPKFMTNMDAGQFVPRIMMKFMRFPIDSYERLLLRGIQQADAKQALAMAGNIGMWAAILSMKDAVKDEEDQHYSGDEGTNKLMMDSFMYNSVTGGAFAIANTTSGLITGQQMFSDYSFSMGGAPIYDLKKLQSGDPAFSALGGKVNIGQAAADALRTIGILEELNKEVE